MATPGLLHLIEKLEDLFQHTRVAVLLDAVKVSTKDDGTTEIDLVSSRQPVYDAVCALDIAQRRTAHHALLLWIDMLWFYTDCVYADLAKAPTPPDVQALVWVKRSLIEKAIVAALVLDGVMRSVRDQPTNRRDIYPSLLNMWVCIQQYRASETFRELDAKHAQRVQGAAGEFVNLFSDE